MAATTIKVSSELRDRLNAEAQREGVTVAQVIELLLAERERAEHFRQVRAQFARMTVAERSEYLAEVEDWDAALADGLEID